MRPIEQIRFHGTDEQPERQVLLPPPLTTNGSTPAAEGAASVVSAWPAPSPMSEESSGTGGEARQQPVDRELLAKRERLIERFAAMQLDLGGVYYEMAIRDHINNEVLTRKAADMQRVDAELRQVEAVIARGGSGASKCPACDALYAPGAVFCSQCGGHLPPGTGGSGP